MIHGYDDSTKEKVEVYSTEQTYNKDEVYSKTETYPKTDVYNKTEVYNKNEVYPKTEVYPRENFVGIYGVIANVGSFQSAQVDIDSSTLADYGVINLRDYVVVGVMQRIRSSTVWTMPMYDANTNMTRPLANYPNAATLRVFVYNGTGLAENVEYMVALMKVQGND
jgi:hypothetical protein